MTIPFVSEHRRLGDTLPSAGRPKMKVFFSLQVRVATESRRCVAATRDVDLAPYNFPQPTGEPLKTLPHGRSHLVEQVVSFATSPTWTIKVPEAHSGVLSAIVEDVLLTELGDVLCPLLRKPEHLTRAANHRRQRLRPEDPIDLNFEVDEEHHSPRGMSGCAAPGLGDRHTAETPGK
uniref:Uncharacterized protein n=1 Tax=Branchiostoma floridae TaxID=7739 RepID=C3YBD6_BRAFL|eukprot:XP_002606283.1 hypothetical protein BRAFLDRAFT_67522 [Branchiostoma floridae]